MSFESVAHRFRPTFQADAERSFPGLEVPLIMTAACEMFDRKRRTPEPVRDLQALAWSMCSKRWRELHPNDREREFRRRVYADTIVAALRDVATRSLSPAQVAERFRNVNPRVAELLDALGPAW